MLIHYLQEDKTLKKRIIAVICLVLTACLFFTACSSSKKEPQDLTNSKYLGTWKAVSASIGDTTDPYEDECILTLNPDGTAVFTSAEEDAAKCNWEETDKGIKLTGDSKLTFTDDGNGLTAKILGVKLHFEHQ